MQLQFCLVHHLKPSRDVPLHTHNALEIVFYVDGRGSSELAGRRYPVGRNSFTITPAGVYHDQVNVTELTSICLGLEGSGLEAKMGCYRDATGALRRVCERMAFELDGKAAGFARIVEGLALQATGLAERIALEAQAPGASGVAASPTLPGGPLTEAPAGRIVAQALTIIEERKGDISVAELADKLYLSKDYLRHLFQEHGAVSPIRHIIQTRIAKAKELLADPALSMQAIAEQSGFDTVYYFSRVFKKETGRTPTQFRTGR